MIFNGIADLIDACKKYFLNVSRYLSCHVADTILQYLELNTFQVFEASLSEKMLVIFVSIYFNAAVMTTNTFVQNTKDMMNEIIFFDREFEMEII